MDSLGIPLDTAAVAPAYKRQYRVIERKLQFASDASEGKYKFIIHLPGTMVDSNADSVSGNTVFWAPSSIKFLLRDYTMYATSRTPNYAIWILSAAIVLLTLFAFAGDFIRKRKP